MADERIRRRDITAEAYFADLVLWRDVQLALRGVMALTGLQETTRWGSPCYQDGGRNIVLIGGLKAHAVLSFLKGAAMADPAGLLHRAGPNSQVAAMMRFTTTEQVEQHKADILAYVAQAVALEQAGVKPDKPLSQDLTYPEELLRLFEEMPQLYDAFHALTPGRRRAYNLHFCDAKQSATRRARIEKCIPGILQGRGIMDR